MNWKSFGRGLARVGISILGHTELAAAVIADAAAKNPEAVQAILQIAQAAANASGK